MAIEYINPLSRAWTRMKNILFRPFDIGKWFALGFTAFLAHLTDSAGGGGGGGRGGKYDWGNDVDWDSFFDLPREISVWIAAHQFWMAAIIAGLILLVLLGVIAIWLSSRGKFMFLDNVVHNRSLIVKPWHDFKDHGDSLFLWRIVLAALTVVLFLEFLIAAFFTARSIYYHGGDLPTRILVILGFALVGFVLFLFVLFISKLLTDFIVPIMYKRGVPVLDAWRLFLPLFSAHAADFIFYVLFTIGLYILVGIGVAIGGLLTCCIGFILLIIPYIGSVLMLPVSVTFRALSVEFLEQFGEDFKLFSVAAADTAGTSPGTGPVEPVV